MYFDNKNFNKDRNNRKKYEIENSLEKYLFFNSILYKFLRIIKIRKSFRKIKLLDIL